MTLRLLMVASGDLRCALAEQFAPMKEIVLFEVEGAPSALASIKTASPDLLLTCSELARSDGDSLLRLSRRAGLTGPAILLARDEADGELADEFDAALTRPFRFARLVSLIRALGADARRALSEPCDANPPLTEKEKAILARLARAQGEVVSREMLLREIWGYHPAVATHTLETHIHRLRRKLELGRRRRLKLQTAPGGYLLATEAEETAQATQEA